MLRALSIAALLACSPPPEGRTMCGLDLYDLESEETRALQWVEFLSLTAIEDAAKRKDGSPFYGHLVCDSLKDLRLYMKEEPWVSSCDCEVPPMVCGTTYARPWGSWVDLWRSPSVAGLCFAHEALHWAQLKLEWEVEPLHDSWPSRGYYDAEDLAEARIAALSDGGFL